MHFWRIEKLKQAMAERPLSERETLPYLVVYCALSSAVISIPQEMGNGWDVAGAAWSVLLAVLGTIHIYRQNGGGAGQHFLQRYFAIGWVVAIRWLVIGIGCLAAFYLPLGLFAPEVAATRWYDFAFLAALEAAVYWRIGHHVRDLARRASVANSPVHA